MNTRREGLKISYRVSNSEETLYKIEALIEGVVLANVVELTRSYPNFEGPVKAGIVYEKPKAVSSRDHDQHVGTLSEVLHKKKATCLEAAAIEAAAYRRAGYQGAYVELVPAKDAYGEVKDYWYHAIVRMPDGSAVDPTASLPGYTPRVAGEEWWKAAGHCCAPCALSDKPKEEQKGCGCKGGKGDDGKKTVLGDASHMTKQRHAAAAVRQPCPSPAYKGSNAKHRPNCHCGECTQSGLQSYAQGT